MRKVPFILILLVLSSFLQYVSGQDTLLVRSDLKIRRSADSIKAVELCNIARSFYQRDQNDSASSYINKSLDIASVAGFALVEAVNYELQAEIYDHQSDWEESLRSYLKAVTSFTKAGLKKDEARVLRIIAGKYFNAGVYKKAGQFSEQEFVLYDSQNSGQMASAAEMAGKSYFYLPADSLASKWYSAAAYYYEKSADNEGLIRCYEKSGIVFTKMGRFDEALMEYEKALQIYSDKPDYKNMASALNKIGYLMFRKNDLPGALLNFNKAAVNSEKGGDDNPFLSDVWTNIAICHQNLGNQKTMLESFEKALNYAKKAGINEEAARIERIIAMIYFKNGDNYHAEIYCLSCIESAKSSASLNILQLCYKDYSTVLESGNDFIKALEYYEKYLNLRDSLSYENRLAEKESADRVAEFEGTEQRIRSEIDSEEIKDLEIKSLREEKLRKDNELSLLLKQQALDKSEKDMAFQSIALERERFELSKRDQDIRSLESQRRIDTLLIRQREDEARVLESRNSLLEIEKTQQEEKAKKEKQIRKMAVGIGILMLLVAGMILMGLIATRKQNQRLAENKRHIEKINADLESTNAEVLKQKDIIELKNQSITDSIQYASRIQNAVLPPISFLSDWGLENFILYKPKDIVSGDFYWGVKKNGKIILAAGDCTGHGVPGAFMSMLGHAFLDEIINTREIKDAATVLNILRDEIINTLRQKGTTGETRDGMDISLVIIDLKAGKLDYAGANNPLYIIRDRNMLRFQADRMPIGIHFISFTPFVNQVIEIKKDDYIYLFSDGYADQFGGPKGKKFMYKPFQDLLLRNHEKSMDLQKEILENTFEKWKGDREQVDDVMVIGIKVLGSEA
jgi:serine phosphatase RsbU (regulator of sigma subunit)/tetratricopeptide (TPR) repeat protein